MIIQNSFKFLFLLLLSQLITATYSSTAIITHRRVPRNDQENFLIKKSYDEVTALIDKHFNSKCNLLLQNCIFQNQWERLFGHDKVFLKEQEDVLTSSSNNNNNRRRSSNKNSKTSFYYCQAFIVARFCIDDYLKKSYNDNFECINGTNGNLPNQFKHTIHRNECKKYYAHFFMNNSFSNRGLYSSSAAKTNSLFSSKFVSFFKITLLILIVSYIQK